VVAESPPDSTGEPNSTSGVGDAAAITRPSVRNGSGSQQIRQAALALSPPSRLS
jgi:hypothetical protein